MQIINKMCLSLGMEIKAQDLRIGNLVNVDLGLPSLSVHVIVARDFIDINETIKIIEPIPLTDDWLLKFGFEPYYFRDNSISGWYRDGSKFLHKDNMLVWFDIEIKHVHQLQNLHHSLTGQELTIK